jgi:hypothetical protein
MSIRPITDTLRQIGRGAFIDHASAELAELVRHVEETGKGGTLVLTLKVSKAGRGSALVVEGNSAVKLPKPAPSDTLMWATPEGNLVTSDPAQGVLELREVAHTSSQPLREAAAG